MPQQLFRKSQKELNRKSHVVQSDEQQEVSSASLHQPFSASTVVQMQRLVGNKQTAQMVAQRSMQPSTMIQRYQVEAPWHAHDPVHEVLTLQAIKNAITQIKSEGKETGNLLGKTNTKNAHSMDSRFGHNIFPESAHQSVHQFLRGVVWPDDPEGAMFSDDHEMDYSTLASWGIDYLDKDARNDASKLIPRSHHGDLQFFHGMASGDNEAPELTKGRILKWSRFLSELATGRIDPNGKVADHEFSKELFPAHHDQTFKELFGYPKAEDTEIQQRAAGALMHLVQDSNAEGHTERNEKGEINEFHSYSTQDHGKHDTKDVWAEGKNLGERIRNTPGAERAVSQCTQLFVMLDQGMPVDEIVRYLDEEIFKLSDTARGAGAGKEFQK